MWFYYVLYFLLVTAFYFAVRYDRQKEIFIACLALLCVISGFRPSTCCLDYLNYVDYYKDVDKIGLLQIEPTFFLIANIARSLFDTSIAVFVIYSVLGVFSKGYAFIKLSEFYLLSLIIYSATFFILHEMTQIRVGVASSILLLAVPVIYEKKWFIFFCLILLGTLFHYSFLIFSFFYFLNPNRIRPVFYICLLVFGYLIFLLGINAASLMEYVPIDFISEKFKVYNSLLENGQDDKINVFNPLVIFRLSFLMLLLWKWEYLYERNKYAIILIKIYAFSNFFFVFLYSLPVLAFRTRELLGIVEIILLPFFVYLIKEKHIAFIAILVVGLTMMSIEMWYNGLILGYF
ncbi:MAG TPA: EpsG family protein [Pedobacter sp.]|uniref:EpsG family protein n=1 Tax=Pedobacter sp. TaxID=1411316 RepID=UPI002BA4DB62|nr:EpsG family protein [Pedobacter sp.]HMI00858.1 EpsG family protein [Pedobacter sp.]